MFVAKGSITQEQADNIMERLGTKRTRETEATPDAFFTLYGLLKETNVSLGEDFEIFMENINKIIVKEKIIIIPIEKVIENLFVDLKSFLVVAVSFEKPWEYPRVNLAVYYGSDSEC